MPADQTDAVTEPRTGTVLAGRYLLGRRIGRGGMADVFAAEDQLLHRPVAVKVFRFDTVTGEPRRRVEAEIRTVAALRHPSVVAVFDAGGLDEPAGGSAFVVMELVDGPSLADRLRDGPLSSGDVALLGGELAAALEHLHQRGIVHRDVKPANILLDAGPDRRKRFAAKLTDFGIARLVDTPRLTGAGMTLGTANYVSPEQVTGGDVTAASDIYSLGLVLLECLTGQRAYAGDGVPAALARLQAQPVIPVRLGQPWTALLTLMTAPDPHDRPTADQVAAALSTPTLAISSAAAATTAMTDATIVLPGGDPIPASTRVLPDTASFPAQAGRFRRLRRRPALLGAAAALAVLLVVLLAVAASHGSGSLPTPAPSYSTVPGRLGQHLQQLETAVG